MIDFTASKYNSNMVTVTICAWLLPGCPTIIMQCQLLKLLVIEGNNFCLYQAGESENILSASLFNITWNPFAFNLWKRVITLLVLPFIPHSRGHNLTTLPHLIQVHNLTSQNTIHNSLQFSKRSVPASHITIKVTFLSATL